MQNHTKIWLLIAVIAIIAGSLIFLGVMTKLDWNFEKLSTVKYVTNTHTLTEEFNSIFIDTETADIEILRAVDEECKVVCHEEEKIKHSVEIIDGELKVSVTDTRKWYEHISFNFGTQKITVYLPDSVYGSLKIQENTGDVTLANELKFNSADLSLTTGKVNCLSDVAEELKIKTNTGDVTVKDISVGALNLTLTTGSVTVNNVTVNNDISVNLSTGKTKLIDVSCKNLTSEGSTGDAYLKNVIAEEKINIKRSTGNIKLEDSDARELYLKASTGDIKGTLLTEKQFIADTDTGIKDVPNSTSGGRCEIETDTGNIVFSIK